MIRASLFVTSILCLAIVLYLADQLSFLAPYRPLLIHRYGPVIASFAALFFLNLFAFVALVNRKFFLQDTGRKLAHVEKQLRTGSSISEELSRRLAE